MALWGRIDLIGRCSAFPAFDDVLAAVALAVVCTKDAAALGAFVFLGLPAQELIHAIVPDELQVLDHAHVIFGAIALVQMFQSSTMFFALEAELRFALIYRLTVFNAASKAGRHLLCIVSAAAWASIFVSQISHANSAVHSARCDQLCSEFSIHNPSRRVMSRI